MGVHRPTSLPSLYASDGARDGRPSPSVHPPGAPNFHFGGALRTEGAAHSLVQPALASLLRGTDFAYSSIWRRAQSHTQPRLSSRLTPLVSWRPSCLPPPKAVPSLPPHRDSVSTHTHCSLLPPPPEKGEKESCGDREVKHWASEQRKPGADSQRPPPQGAVA